MSEAEPAVVTNTTPLIALAVATGSLDVLRALYARVLVPGAVAKELLAADPAASGHFSPQPGWSAGPMSSFRPISATHLIAAAPPLFKRLWMKTSSVCIDEAVGRRVARLNGLTVTGSVGILVKARQRGYSIDLAEAVRRIREHGVWLPDEVVRFALERGAERP